MPTAEAKANPMLTQGMIVLFFIFVLFAQQYQGKHCVVNHIVIVGVKAFGNEGLAPMVLDALSTQHLAHDEVGDRAHAHVTPGFGLVVVLARHQFVGLSGHLVV